MSRVTRSRIVLVLNVALIAALVLVGMTAHSIGVLAAGGDYLADAAAIGVSLLAIWLSHRRPTRKRPYGYPNATKIAALVNGGWLLILSVLVALSAVRRLVSGSPRVNGLPVLVVSGIAPALMIGALMLGGDAATDGDDLNMRAVLLDTAADAAALVLARSRDGAAHCGDRRLSRAGAGARCHRRATHRPQRRTMSSVSRRQRRRGWRTADRSRSTGRARGR